MTKEDYDAAFKSICLAAKTNGIDKRITELGLDVIVGPMDGRIPTIVAAAGCPVGTVSFGYSPTNGRPYGLAVVALAGEEKKILQFMGMPKRQAPSQMVDWDMKSSSQV